MNTGFQQFVNDQLPIGVAGGFAGANIRSSVNAPPGGFVANPLGVAVGAFGWGNPSTRLVTNYYQAASGLGFVHRENQGLITTYLGISTMQIQPADRVTLMNQGDFLAIFAGGATVGQKVYADPVTGAVTAAAAGSPVTVTGFSGAISTAGVLTVTGSGTGSFAVGQAILGASIPPGTYITALGSGSGGTGTYTLNQAPAVAITAEAITAYGVLETNFYVASNVLANASVTGSIAATQVLTVSAIGSGALAAGQFISGTGVAPFTQIVSQLPGGTPGGTGTYLTNSPPGAVVSSTTITATQGQIGKISSWGA